MTLLYGEAGLGKTKFLRLMYAKLTSTGEFATQSLLTNSSLFAREYALAAQDRHLAGFRRSYRSLEWLLLDDIQILNGKQKSIEELLNTFDHIMERGGRIVFALQANVPDLKFLGERLASRIRSGLLLPFKSPEKKELLGFLDYKLNLSVLSPSVCEAARILLPDLACRITDLHAAQDALTELVDYLHKNPVSGNGNMEAFNEFWLDYENKLLHKIIPSNVLRVASEITGVSETDMLGNRRVPKIVEARHLAMYAVRELCQISFSEIGRRFGKEHGAILQACKNFEAKLVQKEELRYSLEKIRHAFSIKESE